MCERIYIKYITIFIKLTKRQTKNFKVHKNSRSTHDLIKLNEGKQKHREKVIKI